MILQVDVSAPETHGSFELWEISSRKQTRNISFSHLHFHLHLEKWAKLTRYSCNNNNNNNISIQLHTHTVKTQLYKVGSQNKLHQLHSAVLFEIPSASTRCSQVDFSNLRCDISFLITGLSLKDVRTEICVCRPQVCSQRQVQAYWKIVGGVSEEHRDQAEGRKG